MVDSVGMHGCLSILRTSGNKIGDGGAQALATLLRSTTTLHHLKLDGATKTVMGQGCELLHSSHGSTLQQHLFVCRRVYNVLRGIDLLHLLCVPLRVRVFVCA